MRLRMLLTLMVHVAVSCDSDSKPESEPGPLPIAGPSAAIDQNPADGIVEYSLTVAPAQFEFLPGAPTEVWAYNNQLPGPLLLANVGDLVRVHVTNGLAEPTTVHWHGIRVPHAMDGVAHGDGAGAIQPDETFTYEFTVRDAGTFWYHPHIRAHVQVEAGLYGTFVVRERPETAPDVDADRLFVLDDVRVRSDGSLDRSTNGHDVMMGRAGNLLLVNGRNDPVAVDMGAGRIERWRLVNTANARTFELEFTGVTVIEIGADGGLWPRTDARVIDSLVLPVGARAELLVRLPTGVDAGAMSAVVLVGTSGGGSAYQPMPLVEVAHDAAADATSPRKGHFVDPVFVPIDTAGATAHEVVLSATDTGDFAFTINGQTYPSYETWQVTANTANVIAIVDELALEHPFHLHGQYFQVLTINGRDADMPGWRDVVLVPPQATVEVATMFDNPGSWMYHCHILEHEDWGMMAVVDVMEPGHNGH